MKCELLFKTVLPNVNIHKNNKIQIYAAIISRILEKYRQVGYHYSHKFLFGMTNEGQYDNRYSVRLHKHAVQWCWFTAWNCPCTAAQQKVNWKPFFRAGETNTL